MSARTRRRLWLGFVALVFVPGGIATLLFAHAVWWVNFQSWLALAVAALTGYAAETPVEAEQ